jgi:hypothetical protein
VGGICHEQCSGYLAEVANCQQCTRRPSRSPFTLRGMLPRRGGGGVRASEVLKWGWLCKNLTRMFSAAELRAFAVSERALVAAARLFGAMA